MVVGTVINEDDFEAFMEEIEEVSSLKYDDGSRPTAESARFNTIFTGIINDALINKNMFDTYGEFIIVSNDKFIILCKEKFPEKLKEEYNPKTYTLSEIEAVIDDIDLIQQIKEKLL